jgi:AraC-like DNA-binding protein
MAETEEAATCADSAAARVFHFSTDVFRKHERIAAWREVFGRTVLNIDVAPRSPDGFQAEAVVFHSEQLGVIRAASSAVAQANSRGMITNDDVSFGCVLDVPWRATQLGREAALQPGDGVLLSNGDLGALDFSEACRYVTFGLPRSAVELLVPDLGALFARRIPAADPALQLLLGYLDLARDDHVARAPALRDAYANHVVDLLALTLGATRDAGEQARQRGVPAARLRAIQDDVARSCREPGLSVHGIARRHGVGARYVQRIFEESGTTFTEYLAEQRLAAAYRALRHPMAQGRSISTIAYDCGFSDVSHFNRLFRRRYGCTPSDVRRRSDR